MTERNRPDAINRALALLAVDAALDPPVAVDRAVRERIAAFDPPREMFSPFLATGLAAAGFVALVATLSVTLAAAGAAELGPLLASAIGGAYLALSAVAALPLLLASRRATRAAYREVQA